MRALALLIATTDPYTLLSVGFFLGTFTTVSAQLAVMAHLQRQPVPAHGRVVPWDRVAAVFVALVGAASLLYRLAVPAWG